MQSPLPADASAVGAKLEAIFARANEGQAQYEALGGIDGIASMLHTDVQRGIPTTSVAHRRDVFGANTLPVDPPLTFWQIYTAAWEDSMIRLLSAAAIVSLILGLTVPEPGETEVDYKTGWIEGFAILCSVLIVTTVSSVNDYRKERKFQKLTEENSAQPIRVIRDGVQQNIDVTEIVVGDLVSLSPGLVTPVDGFFVSGMSVVIDESSVTGENDPKKKSANAPIILTGTVVNTAEDAFMLACAVGERSFGGKLLMESRQGGKPRPTPLQERLDALANQIGRVGLSVAALLFVILCSMEIYHNVKRGAFNIRRYVDHFMLCVVIVVVAVPEGLPLAVTIALAYSQNKMQDDNNQVRRLRACETMGNATQICSDKTGTLTQNLMSVVQGYMGMTRFRVLDPGDVPEPIHLEKMQSTTVDILVEGIAVNSSSEKVVVTEDRDGKTVPPYWQWAPDKGNKTDNALLDFVDRVAMKKEDVNNMKQRPYSRIRDAAHKRGYAMFPFTSDRKRMSAVVRREDGSLMHHVKGGSDRILPLCDRYVNTEGKEEEMTSDVRDVITAQLRSFANEANRTIGVAYTTLAKSSNLPQEEPTEPLVWLALLGIQDPLRPEVPEAVRKCQMAGVTVRMCTGDNLDTAVAISRQCGIFSRSRGDLSMTGQEFRNLVYDAYGDEERMKKFWPVLDHMTVMARSQPLDKQLLVLMLMTRGEVVAVTGDGTNDAPALRLANVGFVMRSGTDIAVKSADIVLLDDNFRSVQRAVVWGRCVNDNIRKFLQLQLTVNYVSVALTFVGSVIAQGASSPLTTVQLLWVNLIMDTLAALALATEEPSEDCLKRGPVSRKAPLISNRMHVTIGLVAVYQFVMEVVAQQTAHLWFPTIQKKGDAQHATFVFNLFVVGTFFQMLNSRKLYDEIDLFEGFHRSKPFLVILAICIAFQILAVETFGEFMNVTSLSFSQWVVSVFIMFVTIIIGMASRLIPITEPTYPREFDGENVNEDARASLIKLAKEVERNADEYAENSGKALAAASHARVLSLWYKAYAHNVSTLKVVNAFRRAYRDRDMNSASCVDMYERILVVTETYKGGAE